MFQLPKPKQHVGRHKRRWQSMTRMLMNILTPRIKKVFEKNSVMWHKLQSSRTEMK